MLTVFLTACVADQKFKVQFEPTLPIPYMIVPDQSKDGYNDDYRKKNYPDHHHGHRHENDQQENYQHPKYQNDAPRDYRQ